MYFALSKLNLPILCNCKPTKFDNTIKLWCENYNGRYEIRLPSKWRSNRHVVFRLFLQIFIWIDISAFLCCEFLVPCFVKMFWKFGLIWAFSSRGMNYLVSRIQHLYIHGKKTHEIGAALQFVCSSVFAAFQCNFRSYLADLF